jgi:hypothetical protein
VATTALAVQNGSSGVSPNIGSSDGSARLSSTRVCSSFIVGRRHRRAVVLAMVWQWAFAASHVRTWPSSWSCQVSPVRWSATAPPSSR